MSQERKALPEGGVIYSAAVSDAIHKSDLVEGIKIVNQWGVGVRLGVGIYENFYGFGAGPADLRFKELQWMLSNPWAWAAGGGFASYDLLVPYDVKGHRIVDIWRESKTTMMGYSDITKLAAVAFFNQIPFVMGSNLGSLNEWDKETQDMVREVWMGSGVIDIDPEAKWVAGHPGEVEGYLFSGNAWIAHESTKTNYDWLSAPWLGNEKIILALEELNLSEVDVIRRFFSFFEHPNARSRIGGLIIGRNVNLNTRDYRQFSNKFPLETNILNFISTYYPQIPVAFLEDMGHAQWGWGWDWRIQRPFSYSKKFIPMTNGLRVNFKVTQSDECSLKYLENLWQ